MNPYIANVKPLENHESLLTFTNGEERIFDTKFYLDKGVIKRLRERRIFMGAHVVAGSVKWPGEIDLSYDTLYLENKKMGQTPIDIPLSKTSNQRSEGHDGADLHKPQINQSF